MFLFRRKKKDDEPVDMNARSPDTGLKYKDIALLGQMMKQGTDLRLPRHALYYLYFGSQEAAEAGAVDARAGVIRAKSGIHFRRTRASGRSSASDRTRYWTSREFGRPTISSKG